MEAPMRLKQEDFCEFEANPGFAVSFRPVRVKEILSYPKTTVTTNRKEAATETQQIQVPQEAG